MTATVRSTGLGQCPAFAVPARISAGASPAAGPALEGPLPVEDQHLERRPGPQGCTCHGARVGGDQIGHGKRSASAACRTSSAVLAARATPTAPPERRLP